MDNKQRNFPAVCMCVLVTELNVQTSNIGYDDQYFPVLFFSVDLFIATGILIIWSLLAQTHSDQG